MSRPLLTLVVSSLLFVAGSAWAATAQDVIAAIKAGKPDAATTLATYAADNGISVAQATAELIEKSPENAQAITKAAVQANPSNAQAIVSSALQAVDKAYANDPKKLDTARSAVLAGAISGASNDPVAQSAVRQAAADAGIPESKIEAAVSKSGQANSGSNSGSTGSDLGGLTGGGGGTASP